MADATPSGSGGPLHVSPPPPDGILTISGGVGGITVQLEELEAGAAKLDGLARELTAVEAELFVAWQELCPYQDQPRATGSAALIAVGEAREAVLKVRLELQRISGQVRSCRWDYEMAESTA